MLSDRAAVGLGFWVALIAGLTVYDSSSQPPKSQDDKSQVAATDNPAEKLGASEAISKRIADYTATLATWTVVVGLGTIGLGLIGIGTAFYQRRDTQAALKLARD